MLVRGVHGTVENNAPVVTFPKGNEIHCFIAGALSLSVPADLPLYPIEQTKTTIIFAGDGYGIDPDNIYGLPGQYGVGPVVISIVDLHPGIVYWIEDTMKKLEKRRKRNLKTHKG